METYRMRGDLWCLLLLALFAPKAAALRTGDLKEAAGDIRLVTHEGRPFELHKDRRGRPVLLTFIFTRCPGACPLIVDQCVTAARKAATPKDPASAPLVVAVSFDPENDTPAVLKQYATLRKLQSTEAVFLSSTGRAGALLKALRDYDVDVGKNPDGSIYHSFVTVVLDRSGRIVARYDGPEIEDAELQKDAKAVAAPATPLPAAPKAIAASTR